jgi:hypothetical protein
MKFNDPSRPRDHDTGFAATSTSLRYSGLLVCGHRAVSYNSCRDRHCPKCQSQARDRWLDARRAELLATP